MNRKRGESSEDPDAAVAEGLHSGDRRAWELLYETYSHHVWRYVARLIGPQTDDVSDVVQEIFLAAAGSARGFDPSKGTLWSWLTGIAHHQCARRWRTMSRDRCSAMSMSSIPVVSGSDPMVLLQRSELAGTVRQALAQLTAEHAALLIGRHLDELSVEDLRRRHGGTSDSIRSRLKRARIEFREVFLRLSPTSTARCPTEPGT